MKTNRLLLILALLCIGLGSAVKAQTNKLYIPSITIQKDRTVQIPVCVDNTSDIVAVQFTLELPAQLALRPEGAVMSEDRSDGHEVIARKVGNNKYTFLVHSAQNNPLKGRTGTVLTVPLYGKDAIEENESYQITMTGAVLSVKSGRNVLTEQSVGKVFVDVSPDITVKNVRTEQSEFAPGQAINVSWVVENIGDRPTADGFQELIYLVNEHGTDVYIGKTIYEENIAAHSTVSRSAELTLPTLLGVNGNARVKVVLQPSSYNCEPREYASNNTAMSDGSVSVSKFLLLTPENVKTSESAQQNVRFLLSRSGNNEANEDFSLTATADSRITLPSVVTISRGQSGAYFYAQVKANNVIDNDSIVNIAISGNGYDEVKAKMVIEDDRMPALTITANAEDVTEGNTLGLTITTQRAPKSDLAVNLSCDLPARFNIPSNIVIPAGETKVDLVVEAIDDENMDIEQVVVFTASAEKHEPGSLHTTLLDNDVPNLQLTLNPTEVSEDTGPESVEVILRRTDNIDKKITVKFSDDSNGNIHYALPSVEMSSGMQEIKVFLGPIDNNLVDGERTYNISAAVWIASCSCSASNSTSGGVISVPLTVYDNDGPTLSATSSSSIMKEGEEITVTVSRNADLSNPVVVNVSSDHDSALEYPSTVTIPAGQTSVSFKVKAISNGVAGDDFKAVLTLQGNGFGRATLNFNVSDQSYPDAQIQGITVSDTEIEVGGIVTVKTTIANVGSYGLMSVVPVSFYISNSNAPVVTTTLKSSLEPGESTTVESKMCMPRSIGSYHIYAKVDADQRFSELSYTNNTSQMVSVNVLPPFSASVTANKQILETGESVTLSGKLSGTNVKNKDVEIYVINNGYRHVIKTTSDADGNFSVDYTPLLGQMGHFAVGACYPGEGLDVEMASFGLYGLRSNGYYSACEFAQTETYTGSIRITNPGNVSQSNIKVQMLDKSDNCRFQFSSIGKIEGGATEEIQYTIIGDGISSGQDYQKMPLRITSSEGAQLDYDLYYYVQPLYGHLVSSVQSLNTTLQMGVAREYPITIRNIGKGNTGKITFSLPSWITSVAKSLPSMESGDSMVVMLRLNPQPDMQLNVPRTGSFVINCENGDGVSIDYEVTPVSEAKGRLCLDVTDEFTYHTEEAPHLAGANVEIKNPITLEVIATGKTDANGIYEVELNEGWYNFSIKADKHDGYTNNIIVDPGTTKFETVFLRYQTVSYSWEVVETEVEDVYRIETIVKYETRVPKPAVICSLPEDVPELYDIVPFTVTNKGLVSAVDLEVSLTASNDYRFEFLNRPYAETIAPNQTLVFYAQLLPAEDNSGGASKVKRKAESGSSGSNVKCFYVIGEAKYKEICDKYTGEVFLEQVKGEGYKTCIGTVFDKPNNDKPSGGQNSPGGGEIYIPYNTGSTYPSGKPSAYKPGSQKPNDQIRVPVEYPNKFCDKPVPEKPFDDEYVDPDEWESGEDVFLDYKLVDKERALRIGVAADGVSQVELILSPESVVPENATNIVWELSGRGASADTDLGFLSNPYKLDHIVYTAPEVFPGGNDGFEYVVEAKLTFKTGKDLHSVFVPIKIIRAPVVLLHGLTGDETSWLQYNNHLVLSGRYVLWQLNNKGYEHTNTAHFWENDYITSYRIQEVIYSCAQHGYVATKADVIGHSMGGIISRIAVQENVRGMAQNVHKLITVNTPHSGSEVADAVMGVFDLGEGVINDITKGFIGPAGLVIPNPTWIVKKVKQGFYRWMPTYAQILQSKLGNLAVDASSSVLPMAVRSFDAIWDLSCNSDAIDKLLNNESRYSSGTPAPDIPVCALTTNMSTVNFVGLFDLSSHEKAEMYTGAYETVSPVLEWLGMVVDHLLNLPNDKFVDAATGVVKSEAIVDLDLLESAVEMSKVTKFANALKYRAGVLYGLEVANIVATYLSLYPGDLVVSEESQQGGCERTINVGTDVTHMAVENHHQTELTLDMLLAANPNNTSLFSRNWFHPIDRPHDSHSAKSPASPAHSAKRKANSTENKGWDDIQIDDLIGNAMIVGDSVVVDYNDKYSEKTAFVTIRLENNASQDDYRKHSSFLIPSSYKGKVLVEAFAFNDDNTLYDCRLLEVTEPKDVLASISCDTIYMTKGETYPHKIKCVWADGSVTYNTPDVISFDKDVASFANGSITAKRSGRSKVTIEFAGQSCSTMLYIYDDVETEGDDSESICSTITLLFSQDMIITRQAFRGTFTLNNGHVDKALEDFKLNLTIKDPEGVVAGRDKFEVTLESLNEFEGNLDFSSGWNLGEGKSGTATILFIPTKNAALSEPTKYSFGGSFSYTDPTTGLTVTRKMDDVVLTVKPSPSLDLTYFMQRDVLGDDPLTETIEPSKEAEFSILINNKGYGDASNVQFVTQQPQIVENEKNLLIDFEIISSQFNSEEKNLALGGSVVTDFGTIPANSTAYAQWWMKSSLLGHFSDYSVNATHVTSYDNPDLSLLNDVTIHELIRSLDLSNGEEKMVGFLANDIKDNNHVPDMLYLSNGEIKDVVSATGSNIVKNSSTEYTLTVAPSAAGWNYGNLLDPTYGAAELTGVVRQSDGKVIPLRNFWQTDRTLRDNKDPLYENRIHFADEFKTPSAETYTLTFTPLPDLLLEVMAFENIPDESSYIEEPLETIKVIFNKTIDPATFTSDDLSMSYQGKKQDVSLIGISTTDNKTFTLDLTEINKLCGNGFYNLTVQTAEITDDEGYNGREGKSACWVMQNPMLNESTLLYNGNSVAIPVALTLPNKPMEATAVNAMVFTKADLSTQADVFANLAYKKMTDEGSIWTSKNIELVDAQPFFTPYDVEADKVTYTREFKNTNWQALYVPFPVDVFEFAGKADVAYFTNVYMHDSDNDGVGDMAYLQLKNMESGKLEPNEPYLIKPYAVGKMVVEVQNTTLSSTVNNGRIEFAIPTDIYTLTGTYQPTVMYETGHYGLSGGEFKYALTPEAVLSPFRFYLDITSLTGKPTPLMCGIIFDDETTGIRNANDNSNAELYDLQGRRVKNPTAAGVYVTKGGKRVKK